MVWAFVVGYFFSAIASLASCRGFAGAFVCLLLFSFSCSKPSDLEAVIPEASGTVAAPSGSPVVTQVNSSTVDGAYKVGDVISVRVTFGLAATVTGAPRVLLETGNTDRYADYVSGSGGVTLSFSYTVQAGDTSADLSYVNINSLELNGGTISAPDTTAMNLVLPGLGASGSLTVNRDIVIDTTAPVAAGAVTDGTYHNSLTQSPSLTWAAATDTGGSGIAKYQVAIGTTSGGTESLTWTDIGNVTTYQVTSGISLTEGSTYYASIRAVDVAGNVGNVINSDGWIVDVTGPSSPATVIDGIASYNTTASPMISWTASTDAGSGLLGYELAIGTTAGGTDVLTWTSVGTVTSYVRTGLTLSVGTTYYASIRAIDTAGNATTAQGDGWQVIACDTYGWCPQAYLKAPNAEAGDFFGSAVAANGDTIAVGAFYESSNQTTITNGTTASSDNSASMAGAVYVFKRTSTSWVQQAYIKASNADPDDRFGTSLSIHGDTLAVGANQESSNQTTITNGATSSSNNSMLAAGAVYIYKRTGDNWAQEAYLKAPNVGGSDQFGLKVSLHGDTVAVGAYSEDSNQTTITNGITASADNSASHAGAAYVFKRTGTNWAQEAYIKAPNAEANDNFGSAISIEGDTLAVAAERESSNQTTITNGTTASSDNSASMAGAVYVFKRTGTNWAQEAYIKASKATSIFGKSVSLSGDTLAVGFPGDSSGVGGIINGTTSSSDISASGAGAVFVYKRTGVNWAQEAYIKASNPQANDQFGYDVSFNGDTLVVGAANSIGPSGQDGSQTTVTNGSSVSTDSLASNSGAAYVFRRTGVNWAQESFLKAPNANSDDIFGFAVALAGDTVVVGAPREASSQTTITNGLTASSDNSAVMAGAAYVFTVNRQATWQQQAYVKTPNPDMFDFFGYSVAISGDTVIGGAYGEDSNQTTITNGPTASSNNSGSDSGAVYVIKRTGSTWAQEAYIKAPNADGGDNFGFSVAISGDTAVVGAPGEYSNQTTITNGTTASTDNSLVQSGAVYVFKRSGTTWAQEAYLKASNADMFDFFGTGVAISGDTIAVSAAGEGSNQTTITNGATASSDNSLTEAGAVYIFKRTGGSIWAQEAYLKAPNAESNDYFGGEQLQKSSIAVNRDTVVVGASGEDSNQTTITNGATASSDNSASGAGAVYVFKRTGTTWAQEAFIKAPNAETADAFGKSVSIDQDTIVVGARDEDSNQLTITNGTTASSDNSANGSGAAYVFKRAGTTWTQEAYLKAPNAEAGDKFGESVFVDRDTIAVGATSEDSNQTTITNGTTASSNNSLAGCGATYIFKRTGSSWMQEAYVKAPNSPGNFGFSVGVSQDTIVVGSDFERSNQTTITNGTTASSNTSLLFSGAVYIFQR